MVPKTGRKDVIMKQGDIIQSDTAGVIKHRMMMKLITKLKTAICNEAVALYAAAFFIRRSLHSQT